MTASLHPDQLAKVKMTAAVEKVSRRGASARCPRGVLWTPASGGISHSASVRRTGVCKLDLRKRLEIDVSTYKNVQDTFDVERCVLDILGCS